MLPVGQLSGIIIVLIVIGMSLLIGMVAKKHNSMGVDREGPCSDLRLASTLVCSNPDKTICISSLECQKLQREGPKLLNAKVSSLIKGKGSISAQ